MLKLILKIVAGIGVVILAFVIFILIKWDKTFEAPLPDLKASTDSAVIARGKYLVYGPAHCASCHAPMKDGSPNSTFGVPLSGGLKFDIDPATFVAPNLTPDAETGIGNFSDAQLARSLRYMVKHDGKMMFPFMPFQNLSDEDVVAVISFLRSQPAIKSALPGPEYKFLGKALLTLGALKPTGPTGTPPASVVIDTTVEYGGYVANSIANCVGCHTARDLKTGEFTGKPFAGGMVFDHGMSLDGFAYITPNLTPDPETGVMTNWTEAAFVNRMRGGRVYKTSHMPWESYAVMNDLELKAVYRYIKSLAPVKNKIEKVAFAPEEKLPG